MVYKPRAPQPDKPHDPLSRLQYRALPKDEQAKYAPIRERINHPDMRGPFDTGWGATDFDTQLTDIRIGLPSLPGQVTN